MARVIFDLDGTLIDSAPDIHAAANRALAAEGLAPLTLARVKGFIGRGVPHLVERLLEASAEDPRGPRHRTLHDRFVAGYEAAVDLTRPYPGVGAALAALAAADHRLGVCTNKPLAPTHAVLRHLGLDTCFAAVTGGDSLAVRKPDPAPLQATAAALGEGPVVYVGDSEVDAETAARAGVPFLLFTEGYRTAPLTALPRAGAFADWAALPALVGRLA